MDRHLVGRRALCRRDPIVCNAIGACLRLDRRIVRIEENLELRLVEILLVFDGCGTLDSISIIEQHPEIADTADAGLRAHRRLPSLNARIAENALFRLSRCPIVIDLLVRTAGDTHPPSAAFVLVDKDDAVLFALIDRTGGTGGDATRVKAVLAEPRQIHHEGVFELAVDVLLHGLEIIVLRALVEFATENFLPVRPPFDLLHRPCR